MKKFFLLFPIILFSFTCLAQTSEPKLEELESQFRDIMREEQSTFVVTTASAPFSFDPLNADYARNIDAMRLLYATPLEMDENGTLTSTILENFKFDTHGKKIVFILKKGIRYEDGTLMTIGDLGLAIKRMLLSHPVFPVVKDIVGKDAWIKSKHPLTSYPSGIRIYEDKNTLEIMLDKLVTEPLFRFSLELFSVIPSSCVDLIKNKLTCQIPPASGRYKLSDNKITKKNKNAHYPVFIKFESRDASSELPKQLWLAYMSPSRIVEYANDFNTSTVIKANEIDIPNFQKQTLLEKMKVYSGPKVLYSVITLNPKSKTFSKKRVRQYFAMKYREAVQDYGFEPEGSLFTTLLIGYIPLSELKKLIPPFSKKEEQEIIEHLRKYPPIFMKDSWTGLHPFTYIFSSVLKSLGIPELSPVEKGEYLELWEKGSLSLRPATCGFWPIDPTGDIRMVFTPGMHRFVIQEPKITNKVNNLKESDKNTHEDLNKTIFEDSKMAITTNYSRIYFVAKHSRILLPYGISAPQSWSFFKSLK